MIIAVDFDGTLHDGHWPDIGNPKYFSVEVMQRLKADGHYLIIWTCREGERQTEMINWLIGQGIPFDRVNDHKPESVELYGCNSRKVYAHLYIDDKQVGGLPEWTEIYQYVRESEQEYLRTKTGCKTLSLAEYAFLVGIKQKDLTGRSRTRHIADAREVYWYKLHENGYSYPQIAKMFNRRNHTTVLSAKNRIEGLLGIKDSGIVRLYNFLEN